MLGMAWLALLPGCRVSREGEPSTRPPVAATAVKVSFDAGVTHDAAQTRADAASAAPDAPSAPSPAADAGAAPAAPSAKAALDAGKPKEPEPVLEVEVEKVVEPPPVAVEVVAPRYGVALLAQGLADEPLQLILNGACRELVAGKPVQRVLDEALHRLSCAMREVGFYMREGLVVSSDGRVGAVGALPFDLDPARAAVHVRDANLGSVVSDPTRSVVGPAASWECETSPAGAARVRAVRAKEAHAALIVRDDKPRFAAGILTAPGRARPEGWLSAGFAPGDMLFVDEDRGAAVLIDVDETLRGKGRARMLAMQGTSYVQRLAYDMALAHYVWLTPATSHASSQGRVLSLEWSKDAPPEACAVEAKP